MNTLCRFVTVGLLSACAAFAGASPLDFKANVLDPPAPAATTYPTFVVSASPFTVVFSACASGELPNGLTADGCFAGVNRSDLNWTSLQIVFPNDLVLNSQPVDCSPAASDNIFLSPRCSVDSQQYTLIFTNGTLGNNDFFFITETGVPPEIFPEGVATVLSSTAATPTPEPTSLLLLATGLGAAVVGTLLRR